MSRHFLRRTVLPLVLGVALSSCASPPVRYYSLVAPSVPAASGPARMLVEVLPVAVPERINRTDMVLNGADGRLDIRQTDRWAALPADEIGLLVDDALWRRLAAADSYRAPQPVVAGGVPQYRLALHVERFDAGTQAVVDASWIVRRLPQGPSATCRAQITAPVPAPGPDGAAGALADAAGRLAVLVADSVGRLDQADADACPRQGDDLRIGG
ncbi:MAG: membrane integrity-associated transporter subunit PqiC [Telmatospirillum sp.]|nr:membrane integrity-associated transporter subunit PqiC [Telmatospirillum sp.]